LKAACAKSLAMKKSSQIPTYSHLTMPSPVGPLFLVANEAGLVALAMKSNWPKIKKSFALSSKTSTSKISGAILKLASRQLNEYFVGKRTAFDIPMELTGTQFQTQVWHSLTKIPSGSTWSYKQQALFLNKPTSVRAIARANSQNPISIILPCHRVIGSSGALTGYAGGIKAKKYLLELEARKI